MNWIEADWPAPENVHTAVTLRTGGVSKNNFSSLNPAFHVHDSADDVSTNRKIIRDMLNLPSEPVWLEQIHGNRIVKADPCRKLERADASFTDQPEIVCVVLTADCLPLFICTADGLKVAIVHAGWRGILAGVINKTVNALESRDLLVWMGPAIGPDCFEVGGEVRDAFLSESVDYSLAFQHLYHQKWRADIYRLAQINLAQLGVENIHGGQFCTVHDHKRFYSYRRDGDTGRIASLIWRS